MALHVSLPCSFAWSWFACCAALNAQYVVCVCSYNMQGEPARQLDAAIRDMVLRELALHLAHFNSSQNLAAFGLPTLAAQPASVVVADEIAKYDAATQATIRDERVP
jgi:hypothetical protein